MHDRGSLWPRSRARTVHTIETPTNQPRRKESCRTFVLMPAAPMCLLVCLGTSHDRERER